MGRLRDGSDCPVCVGGQPDPFPPREVLNDTNQFRPPIRHARDLGPSEATPSGNTVAGALAAPDEPSGSADDR